MAITAPAPTRKQLPFLRVLANRAGTTFTYPATRRQASRDIAQLSRRPLSVQLDLELDRAAIQGDELPEQVA